MVDLSDNRGQFRFIENPEVVLSERTTVYDAARWLDGDRRGVSRQKSLDRSVC